MYHAVLSVSPAKPMRHWSPSLPESSIMHSPIDANPPISVSSLPMGLTPILICGYVKLVCRHFVSCHPAFIDLPHSLCKHPPTASLPKAGQLFKSAMHCLIFWSSADVVSRTSPKDLTCVMRFISRRHPTMRF